MEYRDHDDRPVQYVSYCARHAKPQPHLAGAPAGRGAGPRRSAERLRWD